MIKSILGIIIGYAIFVATSLALFKFSGQKPHADTTIGFMILTIIYGAISSFLSGFVAQFISKSKELKVNYVLAFIIAGFATFSYFKSTGNHWTQICAIFIFAPVSILGGIFYNKRSQK